VYVKQKVVNILVHRVYGEKRRPIKMDSRHKNRLDGVDDQHSSRWNFVLEDSTSLCSSILNSFKRFLMTVVDVVVVERGKGKAGGQAL